MNISRLSKHALFIIVLAVLGFLLTFALPVTSQMILKHSSAANSAEPTPEMIAFFERRTHEHIDRVDRCLIVLAELPGYPPGLLNRGKIHDKSKFFPPERVPYIWLTEFHRRKNNNEAFTYPNGVEEQVKAAIQHHLTNNRHHPEFHASPDEMSDVDTIEMVCDWTAIAQELGENGGSPRQWADKTIGIRKHFNFNKMKKQFIYRVIDDIERHLLFLVN